MIGVAKLMPKKRRKQPKPKKKGWIDGKRENTCDKQIKEILEET